MVLDFCCIRERQSHNSFWECPKLHFQDVSQFLRKLYPHWLMQMSKVEASKSGCQKASNSGTFAQASKLVAATPESQPYPEDVLEVDSPSVSAILSFSPLVISECGYTHSAASLCFRLGSASDPNDLCPITQWSVPKASSLHRPEIIENLKHQQKQLQFPMSRAISFFLQTVSRVDFL